MVLIVGTWLYVIVVAVALTLICVSLRKRGLEMEQTTEWWVLQSTEEKWNSLAAFGVSLAIMALICGAFLRGM